MEFNEVVKKFPTTPFLFIGSGFSRRYYGLPDWQGLLQVFVRRLSDDDFAFYKYMNAVEREFPSNNNKLARVASLIMKEFDKRWFDDTKFRRINSKFKSLMKYGDSPFKIEISQYIDEHSIVIPEMKEELLMFKKLSERSIAGIITTNYDNLIEDVTNYTRYIGQKELLFSHLQGFAELYKIHGGITAPNEIVLTEADYQGFQRDCPYLAAKLMTIFIENPIIFIGYSLTDSNIQLILSELGNCLSSDGIKRLQDRFVYVQYEEGQHTPQVFYHSIKVANGIINLTGVRTDNFKPLYESLMEKRAAIPAKVMRMLKEELYTYAKTSIPTSRLRLVGLDDKRLGDEELVIALGKAEDFSRIGLRGLSIEDWYRHIVLHDLTCTADELLTITYPEIRFGKVKPPVHRLLKEAKNKYPAIEGKALGSFDAILNNEYISHRDKKVLGLRNEEGVLVRKAPRSINGLIETIGKPDKLFHEIPYLKEEEINVDELEKLLIRYTSNNEFYNNLTGNARSDFYRLIRMFDYLKYGR